jgi:hypothetical protein
MIGGLFFLALLGLQPDDSIRFPMSETTVEPEPIEPQPAPQPTPAIIDTISPAEFYCIESDRPLIILSSPPGIIAVAAESGPIRARGRFAGGGEIETRTLAGPHVYFLDALQAGRCELLIVDPADPQAVVRQWLTVSGNGPQPPPEPQPSPEPNPDAITVDNVNGFRVLILIDESAPLETLQAVNSLDLTEWLQKNATDWRRWDRSTIEAAGLDDETAIYKRLWDQIRDDIPDGPQVLAIDGTRATVFPADSQILQRLRGLK